MDFDLTGRQIGPYQLQRLIGRGGMAWVYRAMHTVMRWDVALKILDPMLTADADFVARFSHEAQWLNQMDHPNIVKVRDAAWQDRFFYIAMDFLDGESLDVTLARVQHLTPPQAINIGLQVTEALTYAHTRFRLIHRDIKPGNIFLLRDGSIKVLDFGVATMLGNRTSARTRIGTPEYMPVEQYQGQTDERSDIYSLGATLYQMVTGRLPAPFGVENPIAPRQLNPQISPALEYVILRALQRDPKARFQSAAEMGAALRAAWTSPNMLAPVRPSGAGRLAGAPNTMPLRSNAQPTMRRPSNDLPVILGGVALIVVLLFMIILAASGGSPPPLPTSIASTAIQTVSPGGNVINQETPPTVRPDTPTVVAITPVVVTVPPIVITSPPIIVTAEPPPVQPQVSIPTPCADSSPYGLAASQMQRLGCPGQAWVSSRKVVIQQFAHGVMVIFAKASNVFDNQGGGSIYALADDGRVWRIIDTYIETSSNPADWYSCQTRSQDGPEITGVPWRGFGIAWCQHSEVRAALGGAVSAEQGDITASFQSYESGRAFQVSDWRGFPGWNTRRVYIAYLDSVGSDFSAGTWEKK